MRINSRKIRKILGRVRTTPRRILKPLALKKHRDASAWMQHSQLCFNSENQRKDFSYTMFPVRKINVGKILKLWENCYLIILSIHILKLEISGCDTTPNQNFDLPNRSTDLNKTLGIVGTPHEESIAKFNPTKTCQIKRNGRNPAVGHTPRVLMQGRKKMDPY
jgi:hypothetical protein